MYMYKYKYILNVGIHVCRYIMLYIELALRRWSFSLVEMEDAST